MKTNVERKQSLLQKRDEVTDLIITKPHDISLYTIRATIYSRLHYPDLAVMDTYKALLLADEVTDSSGEWHEEASQELRLWIQNRSMIERVSLSRNKRHEVIHERLSTHSADTRSNEKEASGNSQGDLSSALAEVEDAELDLWASEVFRPQALVYLATHLAAIGCLRTAYEYIEQAIRHFSNTNLDLDTDPDVFTESTDQYKTLNVKAAAHEKLQSIVALAEKHSGSKFDATNPENIRNLPDRGFVRREIYPWNSFEVDRTSDESVDFLNHELSVVAPKLRVAVVELPVLSSLETQKSGEDNGDSRKRTVKQLGVFAREDIQPNEQILRERSLLAANSKLHEPLCDACSAPLPALGSTSSNSDNNLDGSTRNQPVPCPSCYDTVFCSETCLKLAQQSYHPALCDTDAESLSKEDIPASSAADALYTLLLLRTLAMSQTQDTHPLLLKEIRYICGDFPDNDTDTDTEDTSIEQSAKTLPYTFAAQVLTPLHLLSLLDLSPFSTPNDLSETWIYNTLYAKIRATASARMSTVDGRPEVAAVHPLWCLANHSCDPNVAWEWAGEIKFTSRNHGVVWSRKKTEDGAEAETETEMEMETKPATQGGIKAGQEILNHYVDLSLPVQERREWGVGALGGNCMCDRCVWESHGAS